MYGIFTYILVIFRANVDYVFPYMEHMGKNAKTELSVDPQVNDAVENKEQFCRK